MQPNFQFLCNLQSFINYNYYKWYRCSSVVGLSCSLVCHDWRSYKNG